ncbi:hypothetical protein [Corynebacterium pseudodiphtheriticum]|uniref:hypothetical protein n=2 Tax=Corynebacterium pseudodiphtheriticum TaxID=37637 RepID=UPI00254A1D4A|nr:hypothetical protein [Corynebacterium pseudodiphtheriticum]MDK8685207.1 hypothetical protein [Corynebacterium pseudodiphtheriticum]
MEKLDYAQKMLNQAARPAWNYHFHRNLRPPGKLTKLKEKIMKSHIVSLGFCRNIGHYCCYWMTYISLGILAVSSSLWAIYMQDNAIVLIGLLFGTALTAWQIHHYKTTIPIAVNAIAIAAGALSAFGFVIRENFASSTIAFLSFGTAGALIAYVVFAAIMIIKSQQSYFR